jgi:rare lipoprotein A
LDTADPGLGVARVDYRYDRTGIASWSGADFGGKYTANGEIYQMNELTAAHPALPLPSIVQVENLQKGPLPAAADQRSLAVCRLRTYRCVAALGQLHGFEREAPPPYASRS